MALRPTFGKSCMAFAIRLYAVRGRPTPGYLTALSPPKAATTTTTVPSPNLGLFIPPSSSRSISSSSSWSSLSSSSFQAPDPPASNGTPVFPDIDFSRAESSSCASYVRNRDPDAVFVVNGASRGIGLEFVRALLQRTRGTVIACCRSPETSPGLTQLLSSHPSSSRIRVVQLDVESEDSLTHAVSSIEELTDKRIDLP